MNTRLLILLFLLPMLACHEVMEETNYLEKSRLLELEIPDTITSKHIKLELEANLTDKGFIVEKVIIQELDSVEFDSLFKEQIKVEEAPRKTIENIENPTFGVQIGASKKPIKMTLLDYNDAINVYLKDGFYKYVYGTYETIKSAEKVRVMLAKDNINGFIVAVHQGKMISVTKAKSILKKHE